jgi:hypothetical protein
MRQITFFVIILFFLISNKAVCQENTSVLFLKKGNTAAVTPDTSSFNAGGFYLYKNAVYNFKLKSERMRRCSLLIFLTPPQRKKRIKN